MGKLAPSLWNLFHELDARWPHRDRTTDGWYADPKVRISYGHNPGHNGYSHAIDVDKDGINPMWIIDNIIKRDGVLWYIIWNRHLYSATYGWKERPYTGSNPHTDHMHIEIRQTDFAEQWQGWWGIRPINTGGSPTPTLPNPGGTNDVYHGDFGPNYGGRDYRGHFIGAGNAFAQSATAALNVAKAIRSRRR